MNRTIYTGCELVKLQPGTKKIMAGSPPATVDYPGNAAARNGTGGLIVIDIDGKNGGSFQTLFKAVPEIRQAPTTVVTTASPESYHLVYRLPKRFNPRTGIRLVTSGVEVPTWYTLPGSVVDGVTYRLDSKYPVADAPGQLLELLEHGTTTAAEEYEATGTGDAEPLLRRLADSPPGERNSTFLEVAFPVLGILGPDAGALELEHAWPGDEAEILHKINSALERWDTGHTSARRISRARARRIDTALARAVFGPWRGKAGTVQRRVFHAIARRCYQHNELTVSYATGSIAVDTGTYPHRVAKALVALEDSGLILSGDGYRTLVLGEESGDYPEPLGGSPLLDPNHPVWLSEELRARHSQVFAYHLAGVDSATRIAEGSGLSRRSVHTYRGDLERAGAFDATADWERLERSGTERREKVREYVSESLERLEKLEQEQTTSTSPVIGWEPADPLSRRAMEEEALSEPF